MKVFVLQAIVCVNILSNLLDFTCCSFAKAQIPSPTDAPQPLSPDASAAAFQLPDGFRMEVVASEPLIASPSAVCWDGRGRMFVSELHGYNLEGQLDIDELNKTGQLDTQVRRVQADEKFKTAAKDGTFGVVKMLRDSDGDGRMDQADVWARDLPPVYGLVPARDGVIVACAPDIVYLADRDNDGVAETREILFTGFSTGALERGINSPQWSVDGWIYFGRGWGGSQITGVSLKHAVALPDSDFRIRADGSAIEPVTGGTHTFGFAMTESGDRFVVNTTIPAIFVAPLPWRYLVRNPDTAVSNIEAATGDRRAWSLAPPHPWRQRRADDPEYYKFYNSRYGAAESEADGWFTAACGPLVYQDDVLPTLRGTYMVCEPSGNLIHRAIIQANGSALEVHRVPGEEKTEFAASLDSWSHPINLTHAPDGTLAIVDYYREIIEDYSAIPRHLQQQYGVYVGNDRGRILRLTHRDVPQDSISTDMNKLDIQSLAREMASPLLWRRLTAMRLLVERNDRSVGATLREVLDDDNANASAIITAMRTLDELGVLKPSDVVPQLSHADEAVRIPALQLSDRWLGNDESVFNAVLVAADKEQSPRVLLQFAMSLGESRDSRAFSMLVRFAREYLKIRWMNEALMSSLHGRAGEMFAASLSDPDNTSLLRQLAEAIAARGDESERAMALGLVATASEDMRAELMMTLSRVHEQPSEEELEDDQRMVPSTTMPAMEISDETFRQYVAALNGQRDLERGYAVFTTLCSSCHQIGVEGHAVGPDLLGELAVAEETLVRQLLLPSERIRPGFETILLQLSGERFVTGILKDDGATSVTLLAPGGVTNVYLRKDVIAMHRRNLSLMPSFAAAINPSDTASLLGWLRSRLGEDRGSKE